VGYGQVMNSNDMEKLAKMAAKEAVSQTFLTPGMDISNPISVQGQFPFLRNLHCAARHARNFIIAACSARWLDAGYMFFGLASKVNAVPTSGAAPTR
jgi:hypothetical protein